MCGERATRDDRGRCGGSVKRADHRVGYVEALHVAVSEQCSSGVVVGSPVIVRDGDGIVSEWLG